MFREENLGLVCRHFKEEPHMWSSTSELAELRYIATLIPNVTRFNCTYMEL